MGDGRQKPKLNPPPRVASAGNPDLDAEDAVLTPESDRLDHLDPNRAANVPLEELADPMRAAATELRPQGNHVLGHERTRTLTVLGFVLRITGVMERLFYLPQAGPTPVPARFAGAEGVTFTSADGTKLYGWFLPARRENSERLAPTVIHAHGISGNIISHIGFTEFLPAAGFNLFIFDYRGYGRSGGKARHRRDLIDDTIGAGRLHNFGGNRSKRRHRDDFESCPMTNPLRHRGTDAHADK